MFAKLLFFCINIAFFRLNKVNSRNFIQSPSINNLNVNSMNLYYSDFHPDFNFRFSLDLAFPSAAELNLLSEERAKWFFYSSQYFRIDFFMIFRLDFKIYTKIKIKSTIKSQEENFKDISVASSFRNLEIIFWKNPGKNLLFCVW